MKKLLLFALLLFGLVTQAQVLTGTRQKVNAKGYDYKEVTIDSLFRLPKDTLTLKQMDTNSVAYIYPVLYIWSNNSGVYKWDTLAVKGAAGGDAGTGGNLIGKSGSAFHFGTGTWTIDVNLNGSNGVTPARTWYIDSAYGVKFNTGKMQLFMQPEASDDLWIGPDTDAGSYDSSFHITLHEAWWAHRRMTLTGADSLLFKGDVLTQTNDTTTYKTLGINPTTGRVKAFDRGPGGSGGGGLSGLTTSRFITSTGPSSYETDAGNSWNSSTNTASFDTTRSSRLATVLSNGIHIRHHNTQGDTAQTGSLPWPGAYWQQGQDQAFRNEDGQLDVVRYRGWNILSPGNRQNLFEAAMWDSDESHYIAFPGADPQFERIIGFISKDGTIEYRVYGLDVNKETGEGQLYNRITDVQWYVSGENGLYPYWATSKVRTQMDVAANGTGVSSYMGIINSLSNNYIRLRVDSVDNVNEINSDQQLNIGAPILNLPAVITNSNIYSMPIALNKLMLYSASGASELKFAPGTTANGAGWAVNTDYSAIGFNAPSLFGHNGTNDGFAIMPDIRGFGMRFEATTPAGVSTYSTLWNNSKWGFGLNGDPTVGAYFNYTDAIRIPVGTVAQRPTGAAGYLRYNSDSLKVEYYNGSSWIIVGGGGGGSGEVNTGSNLGGGIDNYSTKVGADLRFNTFSGSDFSLSSNVISLALAFNNGLTRTGGDVTNNLITGIALSNQTIRGSTLSGGGITITPNNVDAGTITLLPSGSVGLQVNDLGGALQLFSGQRWISQVNNTGSNPLFTFVSGTASFTGDLARFRSSEAGDVGATQNVINAMGNGDIKRFAVQADGNIYSAGIHQTGTTAYILSKRTDSLFQELPFVPVAFGGTGLTATTVGGILVGSSTTAFTNLTIGTSGYVLTSNGTTASWQPAAGGSNTVPNGMTGFTSTTAYGVITGGTTSTGNLQNAGAGTAGQIFISGGASALPAWTTKNYINADGNTSATAASIFSLGSHNFTINKSSTGDFKITGLEYGTSGELIGIDASGVVKKFKTQLLDSVDVNTTDATPVTVYTVIPDAGSQQMITVHVEFNSFKLGAAGGYYAKKKMTFTWDGGSTTLVNGTITDEAPEEFFTGLAGCDFNITNSGDNIILTFTGVAATDIHGTAIIYITYSSIGS